jgi:hypothetical protein
MQAVVLPLLVNPSSTRSGTADDFKRMMAMRATTDASGVSRHPGSHAEGAGPLLQLFAYAPAGAVNFRLNLLRHGNLSDAAISAIAMPTLVVCSAKDRIFPSMQEGAFPTWPPWQRARMSDITQLDCLQQC